MEASNLSTLSRRIIILLL